MNYIEIIKLYIPAVLFIFFLVLFLISKKKEKKTFILSLEKLGIPLTIPIQSYIMQKIILLLLGAFSLTFYITYDFSKFFPEKLEMAVFFDKEGISNCLKKYTDEEIKNLKIIDKNYEKCQLDYYKTLDEEVKRILNLDFFSIKSHEIHSDGKTTFVVEKTQGIHNYYISESIGELTHIAEKPHSKAISFISYFEKCKSPSDKISVNFFDIFIKNKIILKPRFKQIVAESIKSQGKEFDHILGGYTVLTFFPIPKYSNTLYLLQLDSIGLIPIGYAVYR